MVVAAVTLAVGLCFQFIAPNEYGYPLVRVERLDGEDVVVVFWNWERMDWAHGITGRIKRVVLTGPRYTPTFCPMRATVAPKPWQ
jgi:hypothetical protein